MAGPFVRLPVPALHGIPSGPRDRRKTGRVENVPLQSQVDAQTVPIGLYARSVYRNSRLSPPQTMSLVRCEIFEVFLPVFNACEWK